MDSRNALLYGRRVNWDDIAWEPVRPGVRRRVYASDDVMLVMNELTPEMEVRAHSHDDFDQLVTITEGHGLLRVGDETLAVGPGDLVLIPATVPHCISPSPDAPTTIRNIDLFLPPRDDLTPGAITGVTA